MCTGICFGIATGIITIKGSTIGTREGTGSRTKIITNISTRIGFGIDYGKGAGIGTGLETGMSSAGHILRVWLVCVPGSFSLLFFVCILQLEERLRERACLTPPVCESWLFVVHIFKYACMYSMCVCVCVCLCIASSHSNSPMEELTFGALLKRLIEIHDCQINRIEWDKDKCFVPLDTFVVHNTNQNCDRYTVGDAIPRQWPPIQGNGLK